MKFADYNCLNFDKHDIQALPVFWIMNSINLPTHTIPKVPAIKCQFAAEPAYTVYTILLRPLPQNLKPIPKTTAQALSTVVWALKNINTD